MRRSTGNSMIVFTVLAILATVPASALGPSNARLHGFGGAGVAVVTQGGQSAMAVNPAAPGFLEHGQVNLNFNYGEREIRGEDWNRASIDGDYTTPAIGVEGYLPVGPVVLFGSAAGYSERKEWTYYDSYHDPYVWGDREEQSTLFSVGAAGRLGGMVALGGRFLSWSRSVKDDVVRGGSYDISHRVNSGEAGLLVATPAGFNLGLTWRSGDGEGERIYDTPVTGFNETFKAGAAYQRQDGNWLVGVEYVHQDRLDLGITNSWADSWELIYGDDFFLGGEQYHLYGEYRFRRVSLRAGLCSSTTDQTLVSYNYYDHRADYHFDIDGFAVSLGASGGITDAIGWDLFVRRATEDGRGDNDDNTIGPLYEYDTDSWVAGAGLTFLFGGAGD